MLVNNSDDCERFLGKSHVRSFIQGFSISLLLIAMRYLLFVVQVPNLEMIPVEVFIKILFVLSSACWRKDTNYGWYWKCYMYTRWTLKRLVKFAHFVPHKTYFLAFLLSPTKILKFIAEYLRTWKWTRHVADNKIHYGKDSLNFSSARIYVAGIRTECFHLQPHFYVVCSNNKNIFLDSKRTWRHRFFLSLFLHL